MGNEKEHQFIAYCLKQGYISMDKVKEILELKAREGKSIIPIIAKELGWGKKEVLHVVQEAKTEVSGEKSVSEENNTLPSKGHAFGKYVLVEKIGTGGMGAVYKAYHPQLQTYFAIKTVLPGQMDDSNIQRFKREASISSQLKHPNIVRVYDVGIEDDQYYIVMDYIKGKDLSKLIKEGNITFRRALKIILQIAKALTYAHEKNVIHRDIKPSNILVADDQEASFLMDFGLASILREDIKLTRSGQLLGTPQYMSPEQALGKTTFIDGRSDIYSLGAVLYELLTARPVVTGNNSDTVIYKVIHEEPVSPSKYRNNISRELEAITSKCLEKEQSRRYQKADDLVDDIDRYLRGEAVLARSPGYFYRLWCKAKRNGKLVAVAATSILIVIAVLILWGINVASEVDIQIASLEKQAKELENSKTLKGAADIYLSILKLSNTHKEASDGLNRIKKQMLMIAKSQEEKEDLKEAKRVYEEILYIDEFEKEAIYAINRINKNIENTLKEARTLESKKFFDMALYQCNKLINWAPENPQFGKYILELTQKKEQCRKEARKYYDRAMEIFWNPGLDEKEIMRCNVLFEKAIEEDPAYADAYFQAGRASHRLYDIDKAKEHYENSIKFDPNLTPPKYYLTVLELLYRLPPQWQMPPPVPTRYSSPPPIPMITPSVSIYDERFRRIWSHDIKEAPQITLETDDPYPLLAKALYLYRKLLIPRGEEDSTQIWGECYKYCSKVIEKSPYFADAYFIRARLNSYMIGMNHFTDPKDLDQALQDSLKGIYLDPLKMEGYSLRGAIYQSVGAYEYAAKDYTKALVLKYITMPVLYHNRAVCYVTMGRYQMALDDINRHIELAKRSVDEDAFLFRMFLKAYLNDKKGAEKDLDEYMKKRSRNFDMFDDIFKSILYLFIDENIDRASISCLKCVKNENLRVFFRLFQSVISLLKTRGNGNVQDFTRFFQCVPNLLCAPPELKKYRDVVPDISSFAINAWGQFIPVKDIDFSAEGKPVIDVLINKTSEKESYARINAILQKEYPPLSMDFLFSFIFYISDQINIRRLPRLKDLPLASLYYRRAIEYYIQKDLEKAIDDLRSALELDPCFMEAHYGLATLYSILSSNIAHEKSLVYREEALHHLKLAIKNGWKHLDDYTLRDDDFKPLGLGKDFPLETLRGWDRKRIENQKNIEELQNSVQEDFISRGKYVEALRFLYQPVFDAFPKLKDMAQNTEKNVVDYFLKEMKTEDEQKLENKIDRLFGERGKVILEYIKRENELKRDGK